MSSIIVESPERRVEDRVPELIGPLDAAPFPDTLGARVVTPGSRPRLHGYDVEADLALHYDPSDLTLLALTGELPSEAASAGFAVATMFLAPASVAHASVHAAALSRVCGTSPSSTIGVAAIGLAEQARLLVEEHAELLAWLALGTGAFPARYQTSDPDELATTERLRRALGKKGFELPELAPSATASAALFAVLYRCGLREPYQLETAIAAARLPTAVAEAMTAKIADFSQYPTNLPRYRYHCEERR